MNIVKKKTNYQNFENHIHQASGNLHRPQIPVSLYISYPLALFAASKINASNTKKKKKENLKGYYIPKLIFQ